MIVVAVAALAVAAAAMAALIWVIKLLSSSSSRLTDITVKFELEMQKYEQTKELLTAEHQATKDLGAVLEEKQKELDRERTSRQIVEGQRDRLLATNPGAVSDGIRAELSRLGVPLVPKVSGTPSAADGGDQGPRKVPGATPVK